MPAVPLAQGWLGIGAWTHEGVTSLQGKQVNQAGGLCSSAGPQKNRARAAACLGLIAHSGFRLQPGRTGGSYADNEGSCLHLARIPHRALAGPTEELPTGCGGAIVSGRR